MVAYIQALQTLPLSKLKLAAFATFGLKNCSLDSDLKGCQDYTVKSGDNLWTIASQNLGSGAKYAEIMHTLERRPWS